MSRNNKNKQNYTEADAPVVAENVVEAPVVEEPVEAVVEAVETEPETVEPAVVEEVTPEAEVVVTPVAEVKKEVVKKVKEVKTPVEEPVAVKAKPVSGRYSVVIYHDGSPLKVTNILKKLNNIGENYTLNEKVNVISTKVFATNAEATNYRKYLVGKGLKPVIEIGI